MSLRFLKCESLKRASAEFAFVLAVCLATNLAAQDDASTLLDELNRSSTELSASFEHRFPTDGMPTDLFAGPARITADGMAMNLQSNGSWGGKAVYAKLQLRGDFDVEAEFDQFSRSGDKKATIILSMHFEDESASRYRVIRIRHESGVEQTEASLSQQKDEQRTYSTTGAVKSESTHGRMRLCRRGNEIHHLIADGDGDWQLVGTNSVADVDLTAARGISLECGGNGNTLTEVVWKRLSVRSEEIRGARQTIKRLDSRVGELKHVFRHDFQEDGFSDKFFRAPETVRNELRSVSGGVLTGSKGKGAGKWGSAELTSLFEIEGDFDVVAEFDSFAPGGEGSAAIMLSARLNDDQKNTTRATHMRDSKQGQIFRGSLVKVVNGKRTFGSPKTVKGDASTGRLRLARRGTETFVLYSKDDSSEFRVVTSHETSTANVAADGLKLRTTAVGDGEINVVWKSLTIRAEKLLHYAPKSSERQLMVMNADGTNLQRLTAPPDYLSHLGSPEWSSDGTKIVFDASLGDTDTSRVIVVRSDGSEMEDLGPGCMPSFSSTGDQIVFTESGFGVIQMDSDGAGRFRLDESGWGSHWSPDGHHIAWARSNNIVIMDVDSEEQRQLLPNNSASKLRQVYWNLSWSNDGKSIAFKAKTRQNKEILAVADLDSADGFVVLVNGAVNADLSWSPDGSRILFSRIDPTTKLRGLFTVDRKAPHRVNPIPGVPFDWQVFDCDWSHDGKRIVFSAIVPPTPVEWQSSDGTDR